jgi:hypothetical protein
MPPRRLLCALTSILGVLFLSATTADAAAGHRRALARTPAPAPSVQQRAALVRRLTGLTLGQVRSADACSSPTPGRASCDAHVLVNRATGRRIHPRRPTAAVAMPMSATSNHPPPPVPGTATAGTAAWLQQAYDLTALSASAGTGDTVAIVDAYGDPTAEDDLNAFRVHNGLGACTTASGCLQIVDQNGGTSLPADPPRDKRGWLTETALDLAAVSSLCPNCKIVLVEAADDGTDNLATAQATAAASAAKQISDSWTSVSSQPPDPSGYVFQGVATIASTGDNGTSGSGGDDYPAALPGVTAAGGTTLTAASSGARGYAEAAYSGAGSGCDVAEQPPSYQTGMTCAGRAYSDVSADADPATGLEIYSTADRGWEVVGGTSLSAPLIAAFEAVTGQPDTTPAWAYQDAGLLTPYGPDLLNDPASGSNGSCAIAYICTATAGYDGPTGAGSISGQVVSGAPGIGGPTVNSGTGYAETVNVDSATLTGGVYPNGNDTTYYWQYGTGTSYGEQTTPVDVGNGTAAVPVTDTLPNLTPDTTYHYRLVATNSAGTQPGYDYAFTTPGPPQNTTAPAVTGTAMQGQGLVASTGTWTSSGQPTFTYQWIHSADGGVSWSPIGQATTATYTPGAADIGVLLAVTVTASDTYGATSATSAIAGPVQSGAPRLITPPSVTGRAACGQTLTTTTGTWNPAAFSFAYQWQRSSDNGATWTSIATGPTYTLAGSDAGAELRATVSATNAYGSQPATTAATAPVAACPSQIQTPQGNGAVSPPPPPAAAPAVLAAPAIVGGPRVGATVRVTGGRYAGATSVTVELLRCAQRCVALPLRGFTYRLRPADAGAYLRVQVTLHGPGGTTVAVTAPVGPVASTTTGLALVGRAGHLTLRSRRGVLALGRLTLVQAHTAAERRTPSTLVTLTRPSHSRQSVRVWACTVRAGSISCTAPRPLRARTTFRLSLPAGARVELIAVAGR